MEPLPETLPNPLEQPLSPQVKKKPIFIIVVLFLFALICGGLAFLLSQGYLGFLIGGQTTPVDQEISESQENEMPNELVDANQFFYAKQTKGITVDGRSWPTYEVYSVDFDSLAKELLFEIGGSGDYPGEFTLVKERRMILVDVEHSLLAFDLTTKEKKYLYRGDAKTDYVFSYAVSRDGTKAIINLSHGIYNAKTEGEPGFELITVDLKTGQQETIFSGLASQFNDSFLTPVFWAAGDSLVILREAAPREGIYYRILDLAQKEINPAPLDWGPRIIDSPDGNLLALSNLNSPALPDWWCSPFTDTGKVVMLFNFKTEETEEIDKSEDGYFSVNRWSPDGKELLYGFTRHQSGTGCESEFYPQEFFVFNLETKGKKPIVSTDEQLKIWYPKETRIAVREDEARKLGHQLFIDGELFDQTTQYPFRIINVVSL